MRLFALFMRRDRNAGAGGDAPVARVRIDSRVYQLAELGRDRITLAGYDGDLIARQRFQFSFLFDLEGRPEEVPTRGVVLSVRGGQLVARYLAPQPYYQRLMRRALAATAA